MYEKHAIIGLRLMQLLAIASAVTGFIWSSSDMLLLYVLVDTPLTPLSVLLLLYGVFGTFACEMPIRLLKHRGNSRAVKENGKAPP